MTAQPKYRPLAWVTAALVVIALTVVPGAVAAAEARADTVAWFDCGDGFQCGYVELPLEYADPSSSVIRVALTRRPATAAASRGPVIVNAGTQAGGGGAFVRNFAPVLGELNRDFDLIGLDTRGVGHSDPLVHCTTYEENRAIEAPLSAALTVADRDALLVEATGLAAKCAERSGPLLPHFSSTTAARDLDRVRLALGQRQIRFLGLSGGAVLGQQYLAMFPQQVASMVLDSPFDAEQFINDAFAFDIDQMVATERTLGTFFEWCRTTASLCVFGSGDPRAAFERLLAKTRQNRIDHPGRWDIVTDGSLIDFVSGAMLFPQGWPAFSQQLAALAADPLPPAPMPTGDDRGFAEYYSQTCLDRAFPESLAAFDRQLLRAVREAPYLGGRYGYAEFKCRQWPAEAAERSNGPWLNPSRRPVLVLAATDDPLAPPGGSTQVAQRLQAVGAVVLRASGHLQVGRTPCADTRVSEFLRTGRAPRLTTCTVALPGH